MKRGKKFTVLAAALVVVAAGYVLIANFVKDDTAESVKQVTVATIDSAAVTELSWNYGSDTLTLKKNGDSWSYPADASFPLDQSCVQDMLSAVTKVTATRTITGEGLAQYGLKQPVLSISVTTADGKTAKFALGDQNEVSQQYYLEYNGGDTVYLIDNTLASTFSRSLISMAKKEDIPAMADLESLTVMKGTNTDQFIYRAQSDDITYTNAYNWFWMNQSGGKETFLPLDNAKMAALTDSLSGLAWESCVAYNADDAMLKSCGLDDPQTVITAGYQKQADNTQKKTDATFTLELGKTMGTSYFARIKDSRMIYTVSQDTAKALLQVSLDTLRANDVCLMSWDTVDSLDVTADGKTSTIQFDRSAATDKDGKSEVGTSYKANGKTPDADTVETFLTGITGLTAEEKTAIAPVDGNPEITLVFHRNTDNFKTMTLTLTPYGDSDYLVGFNGESRLLVSRDSVKALETAYQAILK